MCKKSGNKEESFVRFHLCPEAVAKEGSGNAEVVGTAGSLEIELTHVRPESSTHHPRTRVALSVSPEYFHIGFAVSDRYVVARERGLNGPVCRDSCVEAFLQPPGSPGYLNFEFNALGNIHASHILDPERRSGGFADYRLLSPEECSLIEVSGGIGAPTKNEIESAFDWSLEVRIPWVLFAKVIPGFNPNGRWRGNFYKCADESSHPHWISWAPVPELNFHCPEAFGAFRVSGVD